VTNARHWIEVNQSSGPIPPSGGATAYDPQLGGLVLFGGASWSSGADGYLNSTWLFRSGGWTELCDGTTFNRSCPTAPPAREDAEMTYDTARQEMLLFGGIGSLDSEYTMFGDTWALRNSTWLRLQATFTAGPLIDSFDGTLVNDPSAGFAFLELPYQPSGDTSF